MVVRDWERRSMIQGESGREAGVSISSVLFVRRRDCTSAKTCMVSMSETHKTVCSVCCRGRILAALMLGREAFCDQAETLSYKHLLDTDSVQQLEIKRP